MFYSLYQDANVVNGGLWFNPEDLEFVEVIDMDSATGATGVNIIQRGSAYITEDRLRTAVESAGHFEPQLPPLQPTGRKHWFPRPWTPPPKPGHLFWAPDPVRGPRIIKAWEDWETRANDEGIKFKDLPADQQQDILVGVEAYHGYYGTDSDREYVVIERHRGMAEQKRQFGEDAIITTNPERAIWKILKELGVEEDAPVGS
jgi:hypothetical protein